MKRIASYLLLALVVILCMSIDAEAQCAMCRATAESATENYDKGIGEGLNSGIIYLMAAPYILLVTVALVFWRKKILTFIR